MPFFEGCVKSVNDLARNEGARAASVACLLPARNGGSLRLLAGGPALPFSGSSASEVKTLLNGYDGKLIKLATVEGVDWYGAPSGQGAGAEAMKREVAAAGWRFVQQEGSGYFFVRGAEKIVITSEMWTGRYVLFRIPANTL